MRLAVPSLLLLLLISPAVADDSDGTTKSLKILQDRIDKLSAIVAAQQKTIDNQDAHIGALMHYLPLAFGTDRKMTLEDGNNFCVNRFFPTVINVESVPTGSIVLCGFMAPPNQRSSE